MKPHEIAESVEEEIGRMPSYDDYPELSPESLRENAKYLRARATYIDNHPEAKSSLGISTRLARVIAEQLDLGASEMENRDE